MGGALPHSGSESGLMALIACLVSTPSASSISKQGNRMQAEKKNPSDPDAVVTADAGAVLVAGAGFAPAISSL